MNRHALPECFQTNKKLKSYTVTNAVASNIANVTDDINCNVRIGEREYVDVKFDVIDGLAYNAIFSYPFLQKYSVRFDAEKPTFLNTLSD